MKMTLPHAPNMETEMKMTDRINTAKVREKLAALEGHTPGPWESSGGLVGSYIEGRHEWSSVALIGHVDVDHESEMHPNEKLIAAAPDLKATVAKLCDALDAERAENERLREALEIGLNFAETVIGERGGIERCAWADRHEYEFMQDALIPEVSHD